MNTLVMYDHQTESLWAQSLYSAVEGPLVGTDLEVIPATQITWRGWQELHPDTLVLDKNGSYRSDSYSSYYRSRSTGIFGETVRDDRLSSKELVVGVALDDRFKAYPLEALDNQPVVNDRLGDDDLLVLFDRASETALVYFRQVGGRDLTFRLLEQGDGLQTKLVDVETGSTWLALTGQAIDGPMKGTQLQRALSHLSFWFAWKDWNPATEVFEG